MIRENYSPNKYVIFFLTLFLITPPFNSWIKLFSISILIIIIFTSDKQNIFLKKNFFLIIPIIILISLKFYSQNYNLIVNQVVLTTNISNNFQYLKKNFDNNLVKLITKKLSKLQQEEILLSNVKTPGLSERSTLFKKFAFQAESHWNNLDEGKYILIKKKLNFWDLGPASLNDVDLNFGDSKKTKYQTNLYFPVFFKINFKKINNKSDLCFKGHIFYYDFEKFVEKNSKTQSCIKIDYKKDYYFLDTERDLVIEIKKNLLFNHLEIIFYFSTFSILILLFLCFKNINLYYLFYIISFYVILFLYFKFGLKPISGYSETIYFDRGMDGMAHYGYARIILNNLFQGNFYTAMMGTEEIFYYMPITRYINSFLMFFFGDNILGSLFLISFFPIFIFKILNIYLTNKISFILTFFFLFVPIFEALGFTIINYISFTVDGYGEGLSYFFLLVISYFYFSKENTYLKFFLIGFLSFLVIGIRPNYLIFNSILIIGYICYLKFYNQNINNKILKIFLILSGFAFVLLVPLHNYIYSEELVFLVKTDNIQNSYHIKLNDYIYLFKSLLEFNFNYELFYKIKKHLIHYIKIYEFWFFVTLLNLLFILFCKIEIKIKIFSISLIFMHLTYLFFLGDPRYSMGCWLLSFIVLIYSCKIIYFPYLKAKFFQQNNKLM